MATEQKQQPDSQQEAFEREWLSIIQRADLEPEQLSEFVRKAVTVDNSAEMLADLGPQDEKELDQWFKDRIGIELPKVAVCPGHSAPFDVACEIHFFRVLRMLIIASRGGAKTSLLAWLDLLAAESFPGFASHTTGPGLSQGERKYEHLLPFVVEGGVIGGKELPDVARSTLTMTIWKNGSRAGIAPGTTSANNGPRTPRLHRDETELMNQEVYKQAGNIPAGIETPDGRYIPAQIVDTSTMKWAHGVVARMKEEYDKAVQDGVRPRTECRIWCIYEIAEEVPSCRAAPKEAREARLKELERDPCELCDCDTWQNDVWDTDEKGGQRTRTLEDVCAGRFFRSRGFKPHEDVQTLFLENDRSTWEAEQECSQPSKEGVYIKGYSQVRGGVKGYVPDPDNGKVYMGVDWGGQDAHSIGWYQLLDRDVQVSSYLGDQMKVLPSGALIRFAEIYRAGIGNVDVGNMAIAIEDQWRSRWPGWRVHERYPDYQNAAGRMDWEKHLDLKLTSRIKKDFDEEVKYIRGWVGKGMFFVDIEACPMFDKSIRSWREENGHEARGAESNWSTHPMAELRYVLHNLEVIGRKQVQDERAATQHEELLEEGAGDDEGDDFERVIGPRRGHRAEVIGVGGAEDSPHRSERDRLGGPFRR